MDLLRKLSSGLRYFKSLSKYIYYSLVTFLFNKRYRWTDYSDANFKVKKYASYSEYVEHQKLKLKRIKNDLGQYDEQYRKILRKRLIEDAVVNNTMSVLCLGARLGTEVKSFLDLGCFAIGLDLNPGENNKYVVHGDFHNIQFPQSSVDIVFTNSLDHVFDLSKLIREIKRILKLKGYLIIEVSGGEREGCEPRYYESFFWKKIDDLLRVFAKSGFRVVKRSSFKYPRSGDHIVMEYSFRSRKMKNETNR